MKEAKTGLRNPVFEEFSWKILQKKKTTGDCCSDLSKCLEKSSPNGRKTSEKAPNCRTANLKTLLGIKNTITVVPAGDVTKSSKPLKFRLRKHLLKLKNLAALRVFLAHFQDLDSRPILRVIPSDVNQVSFEFNDDSQNRLEVISVCHTFFKWVWGVSNSFLADERKDKRKLRV